MASPLAPMTRRTDPRTARLPVRAGELPTFTPVPRKGARHDGWTQARQQRFIEALAETGSVHAACKAVDMSQRGAYHLRRQPGAESFRDAWQKALDLGVQRIEDVAMDRALNGVEEPLYSYGKLVGSRTKYNDRLLMFMLRNRAPERFAAGGGHHAKGLGGLNAVGKMEKRRLKKKWRQEWEEEQRGKPLPLAEARQLIDRKLDELRRRSALRQRARWCALTPETRDAYRHYEELRARDEQRSVQMPDHCPDEATIAAEAQAREAAALRETESDKDAPSLPPPGWDRRGVVEEPEDKPRVRTVKDESWE
ncbi:hypothetical protein GCM10022213_07040 [Parerythrobacter jejuensis]